MKTKKIKISILLIFLIAQLAKSQVILQTDRSFYFQGDNILMEAWILGANATGKVSETVWLVDEKSQVKTSFQLNIQNGQGSALVPVRNTYKEGYYELILSNNPDDLMRSPIYIGSNPPIADTRPIIPRIATQGNQIVCGCPNIFKITTDKNQTYQLKSNDGQFTDSIATDEYGIGTFLYRPSFDLSELSFTLSGHKDTIQVSPNISLETSGYCISFSVNDYKGYLEVRIAKNDSLKQGEILDVVLSNKGKTFEAQPDLSTNPYALIRYSFKDLQSGIAHLLISDAASRNTLYNQMVIIPNDQQKIQIKVNSDKPRMSVSVDLNNPRNGIVSGSLKVIPIPFNEVNSHSSSLLVKDLLTSDIIESSPEVVSAILQMDYTAANRYLIGLKSSTPETNSHSFSNFPISNFKFDNPVEDSVLLVLYSPPHNLITESYVKSNEFSYKMYFEFMDSLVFYYQVYQNDIPVDYQLKFNSKAPKFDGQNKPLISDSSKIQYENLVKINQFYPESRKRAQELTRFQLPLDFERDLSKYYKFETMEEAITELMPGIAVRRRKGERVIRVFDDLNREFLDGGDPVFVVNDIPIFNSDIIFSLDSKKLIFFGVANHVQTLNAYGRLGKYGVVNLKTTEDISNALNTKRIALSGQLPYNTSEISFEIPTNTWPSYNPLIYYNKEIQIQPYGQVSLDWLHNDMSGGFEVIFEGIDQNGNPVFASETYEINVN